MAGAIIEVKYFNTFLLKKTSKSSEPIWNGSFGIPGGLNGLGGYPVVSSTDTDNWVIEESRIRGVTTTQRLILELKLTWLKTNRMQLLELIL